MQSADEVIRKHLKVKGREWRVVKARETDGDKVTWMG